MLRTDRRRARLVAALRAKGIGDERVLAAIGRIPRHEFVRDGALRHQAYDDVALPIGDEQTISQPFTVAAMTTLARVRPGDRVLEVGTGSGYQAAVLAELGARVFSVERHKTLLATTDPLLARLGYRVRTRAGDGTKGWPALAPFDAILVTAGGALPPALVEQLRAPEPARAGGPRPGGRLVIPLGTRGAMRLHRITRTGPGPDEVSDEALMPVSFVPLIEG